MKGSLRDIPDRKHMPAIGIVEGKKGIDLPALSDFLRRLDAFNGQEQTKLALMFQVLVFTRPGEIRFAEWPEFDMDAALWHLSAERMKMKLPHVVPLSKQALAILARLRELNGKDKYVFPHRSRHNQPMSENALLFGLYRMGYHGEATAHGFRRVASTILNEQGWNKDAIEAQLAHKDKNVTREIYNEAEYLADRRKMMQSWADFLDGLRSGANVTAIKRRTAA